MKINIIGAGLAGCECANYLANKGYEVNLYEKRPKYTSPAHHTDLFGELVCSNSLKFLGAIIVKLGTSLKNDISNSP